MHRPHPIRRIVTPRFARDSALLLALLLIASVARAQSDSTSDDVISSIAFGSCIKQEQPMPILETIASQTPDAFIFLGDNIYGDTDDMTVLQSKYEQLAANAGFQRLVDRTRVLATWDDHDFGVNDGGSDFPMRAESQKLFLDFWKVAPDANSRSRPGVYHAKIFGPPGKRLQVICLDTRYFRSPLKRGAKRLGGSWVPDSDTKKTMLGEQQWAWLGEQLRKKADVRLIATSIQLITEDDGQECWANLPNERKRFLDLIRSTKANGCILISGDRHWSELSMIDAGLSYPLYEMTSSSLNQKHPRGTPTKNGYRVSATTYHEANYGTCDIDWRGSDPSIRLAIRDVSGKIVIEKTLRLSELEGESE